MSVLSQDSQRRIVALLHRPPPEWIELAAQYEADKNLEVEYRYKPWPGMQEHENPWRHVERRGHDFHLGGAYEQTPNWQNDMLEWRVRVSTPPTPGPSSLPEPRPAEPSASAHPDDASPASGHLTS